MKLASKVAHKVASKVARKLTGAGGSSAFNPSSLNPLQRFLDQDPTYYGSVAGFPVFTPEESYTSIAQPRAGRCWLFDGSNDYGEMAGSGGMIAPNMSFGGWFKFADAGFNYALIAKGTNEQWQLFIASGFITLQCGGSAGLSFPTTGVSGWNHWFATVNGTTGKIYRNGAEVVSGPVLAMPSVNTSLVRIGLFTSGVWAFGGSLKDILIDDEAYTAGEVLSLYTTHTVPSGKTPLAFFRCEEESGTTGYNSLSNSNHLTLTNITQSTFHALDTGVQHSDANERGHTVSGSVIIPRSVATPSQDVAGNTLGVTGPVAKLATAEVRCVTGDGSAAHATVSSNFGIGTTSFTICAWVNITSTLMKGAFFKLGSGANGIALGVGNGNLDSIGNELVALNESVAWRPSGTLLGTGWKHVALVQSALGRPSIFLDGVLVFSSSITETLAPSAQFILLWAGSSARYFSGPMCDVHVFNVVKTASELTAIRNGFRDETGLVAHYPCQEGPGTTNTNRTIYDTVGTNNLTLVNGTVSTMWANYCPYARSHCIEYGGGVAVNGAFIPGRIGSGLDALGNAKAIPAGEPSPYDLIYPNRWGTPELVNVGIASSTAWGKTTAVQATSPADTKFRNVTKGTKNLVYRDAKSGADKTNLETYVST